MHWATLISEGSQDRIILLLNSIAIRFVLANS